MDVYDEIKFERVQQEKKWGEQNHPCLDEVLLKRDNGCTPERMCEHYEIPSESRARNSCETRFKRKEGTYADIALEEFCEVVSAFNVVDRRQELIQLAAVCVAWVEKIDRGWEKELFDSDKKG